MVSVKLRVVLVAPAMGVKVEPPSVLTCHCTVGVGLPLAAAVKVAVCPAVTVWLAGWVVTIGAVRARSPSGWRRWWWPCRRCW